MDKKTPTKRKSLANANTPKPNKIQKTVNTPVSQKKNNKTPKSANKNKQTPQGKQLNGKQNTPKEKKKGPKQPKPEPVEDEEVENESEENESDNSIEQENGENSLVEEADSNEDEESDEADDNEDVVEKKKPGKIDEDRQFSVYVAGLNGTITENQLRGFFNESIIASVHMLKVGREQKILSAFVNFKDEASREKALTKNGTELKGCTIKVGLPKTKPRLPPAEYKKKNTQLLQLYQQVRKLEQELGKRPNYNKFQKPTNFKPGMKGKFTGKNKVNKKPFKQE